MNFCGKCGNQMPEGANVCPNCGTPVNGGQQPMYQQPMYQQPINVNAVAPKATSGTAIASMVLGIVSVCLSCCFYYVSIPCAIVGAVLAVISMSGKKGGKGMAIAGLVTSIVSLVPAIITISIGASIVSELQNML